jgi:hypothetical protein
MNIEEQLKNKEIIYLKLVTGEDVFAMIENEFLKNQENAAAGLISLHQPFVLKTIMIGAGNVGSHPASIEYATRWCPYADIELYENITIIASANIIRLFKPQDDMIARYISWITDENAEQLTDESLDENVEQSDGTNRKLH